MPTARTVRPEEKGIAKPIYVVWELTMRCDQACAHCGSRAFSPRPSEVHGEQLFAICDQLHALGTREVTLIGGEAYLHPDVYAVTERLANHGIKVTMQTGGRGLTRRRLQTLKDAGLKVVGVSVDGPEEVHDTLRANKGSHKHAIEALHIARDLGVVSASNTQFNRLNAHLVEETFAPLQAAGVRSWRGQVTAPMGRAADQPDWILQPWQVVDIIDAMAALQLRLAQEEVDAGRDPLKVTDIRISNNLGYYGPWEGILRTPPGETIRAYGGCGAGKSGMGIESDGTIKACPSLPTAPYRAGNILEMSVEEAWQTDAMGFARDRGTSELWGFCKTCDYAELCQGGCSFTAHTTLGRRGNMPFCYHRVTQLKRRGVRERLVHKEAAAGQPYDFGRFELVEEPWPA